MPLYLVQETDKPDRIIKAKSDTAALAYVTTPRFTVSIMSNPMEVADKLTVLLADGGAIEDATNAAENTK